MLSSTGAPDSRDPSSTLWQVTAPAAPALTGLDQNAETDVLVIGGGVAGLSTALHLAERGVDVMLVEAAQPGSGATGQSGGLIAPDYIRHNPASIGHTLGSSDAGERMTRLIGRAAQRCFDLIARHRIDCDARQDGFYTPVHTHRLAAAQRDTAQQWQARGFDVTVLDGAETQRRLGTRAYCGALHFSHGGWLNPLAYARGLARAAVAAGARLHVETPVDDLVRLGDRWRARTPGGIISARRVVLAANGGNARLHPAMRHVALPLHVFEFATAPLAPDLRARVLPEGGAFTDKSPYIFSARYDGAGRLISAFPKTFLVRGEQARRNEAKRRLARYFKGFEAVGIDSLWEGVAWINASFLPEIYDLGDGALAVQACNGRGISLNSAIGIELAEALAADDLGTLSIRPRPPRPFPFHRAAARLPKAMMTLAYLSD
jgi:glycine/D-amino acid oxidase-like deaminating enzyme